MSTVNYTIRIEEIDKKEAEQVFNQLGLTEKTSRIKLEEAFEEAQKEAVINGTDNITMDEINDIIAEERRKERGL